MRSTEVKATSTRWMLQIFLFPCSHRDNDPIPSPSSRQSPTSSQPMTSASSPSSSWGRTQWSTTAGRRSILVWRESARTTLAGGFSSRTPGPRSWRRGSTAPALGRFPSTTTSCRAPSTCPSRTSSTASSPPMCEWTHVDICYVTAASYTGTGRVCTIWYHSVGVVPATLLKLTNHVWGRGKKSGASLGQNLLYVWTMSGQGSKMRPCHDWCSL